MTEATYAGTTGWSGTDTSREQAEPARHRPVQSVVLSAVTRHSTYGVTIADLRRWHPDIHHGSLSSALTNLHRAGRITRLTEKRDRCKVYVLPDSVVGRPTEPPTPPRQDGGYADGYTDGRKDAIAAVEQHCNALLAAMGVSAATHNDRCWLRHPACAVRAVRKAAAAAAEGPVIR